MATGEVDPAIEFTLNGQRHRLSRSQVEVRLSGVTPRTVTKYAVEVKGVWYPLLQAFGVATGVAETQFNSHTALRHLKRLKLPVRGEVSAARSGAGSPPPEAKPQVSGETWHTEENVQQTLVAALEAHGWQILSQANTRTRERGIDVVAHRGGETVGVEVKGYPTTTYADHRRAGETKPTHPTNQAVHWYAQAVLAAMRLRTRHPEYLSVIALPDFSRYRTLFTETGASLTAAAIEVWWVAETGEVEGLK